jgi:hypothetical protein
VKTIDRLPGEAQAPWVEPFLIAQAAEPDLDALAKLTERLDATLNPDGTEPRLEQQRRRREFMLHKRANGTLAPDRGAHRSAHRTARNLLRLLRRPRPRSQRRQRFP